MERKQKSWYRILWTSETTLAFGGAFMWGWVLLLPAFAIAVGVVSLFGSVADVKDTDTRIALWGAGALSLFFGYCVGYLSGYGSAGRRPGTTGTGRNQTLRRSTDATSLISRNRPNTSGRN